MAAGYFDDGVTSVGLDESPSALISGQGFGPVELTPWNRTQSTLFQRGGGYMQIRVNWGLERYNRGDAEWYVYTKCKDLGSIGRGELMVNGLVYENAVCVSANAGIEQPAHEGGDGGEGWSCWVQMSCLFECSILENTNDPSASYSPPATPGEYAARTSTGAFTFGGNDITDDRLLLVPSLRCQHIRREIPQAYGVRYKDQVWARTLSLRLDGVYWQATRPALEDAWRDFLVTARDDVNDLVGNGNTFSDCYMVDAPAMDDNDRRLSDFSISFVQAPS